MCTFKVCPLFSSYRRSWGGGAEERDKRMIENLVTCAFKTNNMYSTWLGIRVEVPQNLIIVSGISCKDAQRKSSHYMDSNDSIVTITCTCKMYMQCTSTLYMYNNYYIYMYSTCIYMYVPVNTEHVDFTLHFQILPLIFIILYIQYMYMYMYIYINLYVHCTIP